MKSQKNLVEQRIRFLDNTTTESRHHPQTSTQVSQVWHVEGFYINLHRILSITLLSKPIPVTAKRIHMAPSRSVQWAGSWKMVT